MPCVSVHIITNNQWIRKVTVKIELRHKSGLNSKIPFTFSALYTSENMLLPLIIRHFFALFCYRNWRNETFCVVSPLWLHISWKQLVWTQWYSVINKPFRDYDWSTWYLKSQFLPRSKQNTSSYKNKSLNDVKGNDRYLLRDPYKT